MFNNKEEKSFSLIVKTTQITHNVWVLYFSVTCSSILLNHALLKCYGPFDQMTMEGPVVL